MFVDCPIGASYVTNGSLLVISEEEIAEDLVYFLTPLLEEYPEYKVNEIFSCTESSINLLHVWIAIAMILMFK